MISRRSLGLGIGFGLLAIATLSVAGNRATASGPEKSKAYATVILTNSLAAAQCSAIEIRRAVTRAMQLANRTKPNDLATAVNSLIDVYQRLGRNSSLTPKERQRLGLQVRSRLQRFTSHLRYDQTHSPSRSSALAETAQTGAAGPPATEGLNAMVELIQTTIARPDDWLAQQIGPIPAAGNAQPLAVGFGAGGGAAGGGGGPSGNADALARQTNANGADLVDLIQKTIDPPSWDINGGPGSIAYFNSMRVLVVNQSGENHDAIGGVVGDLRK